MGTVTSWCTGAPDATYTKDVPMGAAPTSLCVEDLVDAGATPPATDPPDALHVFVRQRSRSLAHLVELAAAMEEPDPALRKRAVSFDAPPSVTPSTDAQPTPEYSVRAVSFALGFGKGSTYVFHVSVGAAPIVVVTKTRRECKKLYAVLRHFHRASQLPPFPPKAGLLQSKDAANSASTSFMQDFLTHLLAIPAVRTSPDTLAFFLVQGPKAPPAARRRFSLH
ncbi:hypothetical protein ACHHYP_02074 [Achlya hypogyna]|uniref:PX domain-containing protein n=1 Tax=Achlya hypogyna TaxID=1202772 RepID=A0A1V9ZSI5_ACHHY|nr:hypothetical protein ACHHYP_02074 [Achlya hypogyna]